MALPMLALAVALSANFDSRPAQAATDQVSVRVGVYDNPPKIWVDENGQAQGFWADLTNEVARLEGWQVTYVDGTWAEGLERLETGDIDMMVDVALSDERKQLYDFNDETVLINWGTVYTREGSEIKSIADLSDKKVAVMKSGIHYSGPLGLKNVIQSFGLENVEVIDVDEYADVFELLDSNQADAGVVNRLFGQTNESKYRVQPTNIIFNPIELRYAFTKGGELNHRLIAAIDHDLIELKADPNSVYHVSLRRHLPGTVEKVEVFPRWFKYLMASLLALFAVVFAYVLALRLVRRRLESLVRARTVELEKEKRVFQSLFQGSNDPIVLIDASSLLIVECNDAAWKTLGYDKKDYLIGKSPLEFSAPNQPSGRPAAEVFAEAMGKVVKKGKVQLDWVCRDVDGAEIYTMVMLTPLEWKGRKVIHVDLRDITEQKKTEGKMAGLDRLKSRFITILSHVTRTPLNRIRWSLESLESGEFGKLEEEGQALVRQALDSNEEVLWVINNMNATLDIERDALTLESAPASLESLVNSAIGYFQGLSECKDVTCSTDLPSEQLPAIRMDAEKIRQAIFAMMDNARRYMTGEKKEVSVSLVSKGGFARLSITDSGIGIPKAEQKSIFDRFFRASNAAVAHPDGIGLGLFIAKAVVEKHGGRIGFESEEGKGSTFWFELPLSGQQAERS